MHPLYYQSTGLINQPVTIHLLDGQTHYGTIQSVTTDGIYFVELNNISVDIDSNTGLPATAKEMKEESVSNTRIVPLFFPFAALAGFTLGLAAGATVPRPYVYPYYSYPYYPYPGGYPYYW